MRKASWAKPPRRRLGAALGIGALAVILAACGSSSSSSSPSGSSSSSSGKKSISIGLSNYYSGNLWRKEMVASFVQQAQVAQKEGYVSKFTTADSNGSVPQQASQIESMIVQGYNAIVIDAASPTALNGAIAKACAAHITVVVFDSLATAPCAYKVATSYEKYGQLETQYLADQLHGKGNVLIVRGIAGNSVDNDIYKGMQDILSKYPNMKVVGQVHGEFTESVTQQAVAGILPSLPHVDGVLTEGDDAGGALKAFQQANKKPLPLVIMGNAGQDLQEWTALLKTQPSYQTISVSSYPSMSSVALWEASMIANGKKVPKLVYAPVLTIPKENLPAWTKAMSYTQIANTALTQADAEKFVAASAAGKPIYVASPLPNGTGLVGS